MASNRIRLAPRAASEGDIGVVMEPSPTAATLVPYDNTASGGSSASAERSPSPAVTADRNPLALAVGDPVEVLKAGKWCKTDGRVDRVNGDGTYDITADGCPLKGKPASEVRRTTAEKQRQRFNWDSAAYRMRMKQTFCCMFIALAVLVAGVASLVAAANLTMPAGSGDQNGQCEVCGNRGCKPWPETSAPCNDAFQPLTATGICLISFGGIWLVVPFLVGLRRGRPLAHAWAWQRLGWRRENWCCGEQIGEYDVGRRL